MAHPQAITRESIPVEELIIPVESRIFDDREDASFYIGILAVPGQVIMSEEYEAWLRLRGNVYIDEMKFLPPEARDERGLETDEDDARSIHIGVFANRPGQELPVLMGGVRLILKDEVEHTLPVERIFPEAFEEQAAPTGSVEVSRLISRFPDRVVQAMASMALIRATTLWTYDNGRQPAYAVIEERKLGKLFNLIGLPYEALSSPRMVEKYNTENTAVSMDPTAVLNSLQPNQHAQAPLIVDFFEGASENKGLGYFDNKMKAA